MTLMDIIWLAKFNTIIFRKKMTIFWLQCSCVFFSEYYYHDDIAVTERYYRVDKKDTHRANVFFYSLLFDEDTKYQKSFPYFHFFRAVGSFFTIDFWKRTIYYLSHSVEISHFSITQILREINFGDFRSPKSARTHLDALNSDFYEFLHF